MPAFLGRLLDLIYPPLCPVCGSLLTDEEACLCTACRYHLPRTRFEDFRHNGACDRLADRLPFDKAYAAFRYMKESSIQLLFEQFKYHGDKRLATYLATLAGRELSDRSFFDEMDLIVPVPLHANRLRQRGYNQSELIARALGECSGLPVETEALARRRETLTQTRKSLWERQLNMRDVFVALRPDLLCDRHVLLVDDVMTTGATMLASARSLREAGCGRLSFFALALA